VAQLLFGLQQRTRQQVKTSDAVLRSICMDVRRQQVFRAAGYYTVASYLLFYDPEAGRPSVPTIEQAQLQQMIESGETLHLVDVLGEDHWKRGHLPGAEWMDFRSLTREARKRFKKDERIVVYCNSYT